MIIHTIIITLCLLSTTYASCPFEALPTTMTFKSIVDDNGNAYDYNVSLCASSPCANDGLSYLCQIWNGGAVNTGSKAGDFIVTKDGYTFTVTDGTPLHNTNRHRRFTMDIIYDQTVNFDLKSVNYISDGAYHAVAASKYARASPVIMNVTYCDETHMFYINTGNELFLFPGDATVEDAQRSKMFLFTSSGETIQGLASLYDVFIKMHLAAYISVGYNYYNSAVAIHFEQGCI